MKRSEAQTKIYEYLVRNSINEIGSRELLDLVEEIGMAPPEHLILKDSYDRSTGNYGYLVHEWEPENES